MRLGPTRAVNGKGSCLNGGCVKETILSCLNCIESWQQAERTGVCQSSDVILCALSMYSAVEHTSDCYVAVCQFDARTSFIPCLCVSTVRRPPHAGLHSGKEGADQAAGEWTLQAAHVPLLISTI